MSSCGVKKRSRARRVFAGTTDYDQNNIIWESQRTNTNKQNTLFTYVK